jgi:hypothetical protein
MARNAGYVLPANWPNDANYIESLAAGTVYATAAQPLNALIVDAGVPSLGHRNHLLGIDSFNADNREIGVGHAFNAVAQYDHYWAIHATRTSANDRFLTGVAFADANGNNRYDLNEGLANVTITAGAFTTTTNAAGGWSLEVPQGTYAVTATGGGFTGLATALATVSSQNVEVDFVSGSVQGIVDFETPPPPTVTLAIADANVLEGDAGTVNMVFVVTLSAISSQPVQVAYSTSGGPAVAGADFQSVSGVLSFTPGTVTQHVTVPVFSDLLVETNETFTVNLANPVNATLTDGQGVGTILNEDTTYARPNEILVVAPGPGRETTVRVLDRVNGAERFRFEAFPGFSAGAQVAVGDVTGDGVLDIIATPGPGHSPQVRVFGGTTGNIVQEFTAYAPAFTGGMFVAAADFNADNRADIVTAPLGNGGPHVRIFSGAGGVLGEYMAFHPAFGGGVRIAAADMDGNGTPDVIAAAGPGGGPHVRVLSAATSAEISGPLAGFYAYHPAFSGGVYVAAADVIGYGRAYLITGADAGGGPHVRVLNGVSGAEIDGFFAYHPAFGGGVRVGVTDVNGDGRAEVVTAAGAGGGPHVRVLDGATHNEIYGFYAYEPAFTGGTYATGSLATGVNFTASPGAEEPFNALQQDEVLLAVAFAGESSPSHGKRIDALFADVDSLLL